MIENVHLAFLFTILAGLSTAIGSSIAYFIKKPKFSYLSFLMGFSAGVMIYVSFVELLNRSIQEVGFNLANLGFFGGIASIFLVDHFIPHVHMDTKFDSRRGLAEHSDKLMQAGVLTAVGIAIHNFPEGLSVLAVSLQSVSVGASVALAIAIHNIPEGIAVSVPIYYATGDRKRAFLYSFFSGVAEPLGAAFGFFVIFPFLTQTVLSMILSVVAGIMVFICFDELLPIAREYGDEHLATLGIFLGMMVMTLSLSML